MFERRVRFEAAIGLGGCGEAEGEDLIGFGYGEEVDWGRGGSWLRRNRGGYLVGLPSENWDFRE